MICCETKYVDTRWKKAKLLIASSIGSKICLVGLVVA